jgi:hypothetical protein
MTQWWYGHNAVGFFLTIDFLGMMYYFVPKRRAAGLFLSLLTCSRAVFLHPMVRTRCPIMCSGCGLSLAWREILGRHDDAPELSGGDKLKN